MRINILILAFLSILTYNSFYTDPFPMKKGLSESMTLESCPHFGLQIFIHNILTNTHYLWYSKIVSEKQWGKESKKREEESRKAVKSQNR